MDQNFSLLTYLLVVVMRAKSFRRRWDQPLLYGPGYFCRLRVRDGFYEGAGRRLLQRYRMLLLWPYVVELITFVVLMVRHDFMALTPLCLAAILTAVLNQRVSMAILTRAAKKFEEAEIDPAPAALTFSLNPRRLADYTNPVFEIVLASTTTVTLIFLGQMHAAMGAPLVLLYLQIGFLLLKKAIVDWRSAAPLENPEVYLDVRERRRKLFLFACDFYRGALGFVMIKQTVLLVSTDVRVRWALEYLYLGLMIAFVIFAASKSNELYALYRKTKPNAIAKRRLSAPDPQGFHAGGFLYFDPDNPAIFVQGPRSVAINAANNRLLLAATYLLGLVLLGMWASKANASAASSKNMRGMNTPAIQLSGPVHADLASR